MCDPTAWGKPPAHRHWAWKKENNLIPGLPPSMHVMTVYLMPGRWLKRRKIRMFSSELLWMLLLIVAPCFQKECHNLCDRTVGLSSLLWTIWLCRESLFCAVTSSVRNKAILGCLFVLLQRRPCICWWILLPVSHVLNYVWLRHGNWIRHGSWNWTQVKFSDCWWPLLVYLPYTCLRKANMWPYLQMGRQPIQSTPPHKTCFLMFQSHLQYFFSTEVVCFGFRCLATVSIWPMMAGVTMRMAAQAIRARWWRQSWLVERTCTPGRNAARMSSDALRREFEFIWAVFVLLCSLDAACSTLFVAAILGHTWSDKRSRIHFSIILLFIKAIFQ